MFPPPDLECQPPPEYYPARSVLSQVERRFGITRLQAHSGLESGGGFGVLLKPMVGASQQNLRDR
jgi:hypothetical protein